MTTTDTYIDNEENRYIHIYKMKTTGTMTTTDTYIYDTHIHEVLHIYDDDATYIDEDIYTYDVYMYHI